MGKWAVPALFAAMGLIASSRALEPLHRAFADPTSRTVLIALYFVLRAAVTLAFAALTVRRPVSVRPSREPAAFAACAVAMLLVIPIGAPESATSTPVVLLGDLIATVSCVWLLVSVLTLGTCFGVLPDARGLVVRGPYRFVRHPVYVGEIGALLGLTIATAQIWAVAVLAAFVLAQVARMRMEEAALTEAFPQYREYALRTGRLLPRRRRTRQPAGAACAPVTPDTSAWGVSPAQLVSGAMVPPPSSSTT